MKSDALWQLKIIDSEFLPCGIEVHDGIVDSNEYFVSSIRHQMWRQNCRKAGTSDSVELQEKQSTEMIIKINRKQFWRSAKMSGFCMLSANSYNKIIGSTVRPYNQFIMLLKVSGNIFHTFASSNVISLPLITSIPFFKSIFAFSKTRISSSSATVSDSIV